MDDSPKEEKKKASIKTVKINMKSIVDLQTIDGYWPPASALTSLIASSGKQLSLECPPESFAGDLKKEERVKAWATVVALWLLETFCVEQKSEWKRIAAKGAKYLKEVGVNAKEAFTLI